MCMCDSTFRRKRCTWAKPSIGTNVPSCKQHYMACVRHSDMCSRPCRGCKEHSKYRKHRACRPHAWIMLPLCECASKEEAKRVERRLVKLMIDWAPLYSTQLKCTHEQGWEPQQRATAANRTISQFHISARISAFFASNSCCVAIPRSSIDLSASSRATGSPLGCACATATGMVACACAIGNTTAWATGS